MRVSTNPNECRHTQTKEFHGATTGSKMIVDAEEDHLIVTQTRLVRLRLLGSFQAPSRQAD